MPRRRKKSSRSSRKPPLAFSESPLELSRQFSSPVTGAVNPVTADVIYLQDQSPAAKWVSPQFDPNAPPSVRRRRGRRRQQTEELRTACSQNPNRNREPALADLESDDTVENRVCDRRKLEFDVDEVLEEISNLEISSTEHGIHRDGRIPTDKPSDKENVDQSSIEGADKGSSAIRLCSDFSENLDKQSRTEQCVRAYRMPPCRTREYFDGTHSHRARQDGTDTPNCQDKLDASPSGTRRTPVHEADGVRGGPVMCPSCKGACLPLAADTPVHEYSLRVSIRSRRGRLPKAAWEQLLKDVS